MKRQSTRTVRTRVNVEALESRELPSVSLTSLGSLSYESSTAQVRYLSPTTWQPRYSYIPGVDTTPGLIGILIAL